MKKLLIVAVALLGLASCKKGEFKLVDSVVNKGEAVAIVNGVALQPKKSVYMDHNSTYSVVCQDWQKCKVNINGSIFYRSGTYQNNFKQKQY